MALNSLQPNGAAEQRITSLKLAMQLGFNAGKASRRFQRKFSPDEVVRDFRRMLTRMGTRLTWPSAKLAGSGLGYTDSTRSPAELLMALGNAVITEAISAKPP